MKKSSFVFLVLFAFVSTAHAGEIYVWKDKNGVENITTTPPPANVKVKDRSAFTRDTSAAIEAFQRKQKAATDRGFAGWQKSQMQQRTASPSSIQDSREARANKVIEDNRKRLDAVRNGPIKLSNQQQN